MKWLSLTMIIFLLLVVADYVSADDPHGKTFYPTTTNNYYTVEGVASAISAAQCHFDNASKSLQICGAVGFSEGSQAQTAGIAKKYNGMLINGTISTEDGITRYGAGITIKIK